MKVKYIAVILLCCIFFYSPITYAEEVSECVFNIFFNNVKINNTDIKIINNLIYVPLRWYSNLNKANVDWNKETESVLINYYQYPKYKAIEKNGKFGYEDENGVIVIEPQFQFAWDFSEGLGLIQSEEGVFSYINQQGEEVIKNIYPYTYEFKDGVTLVIDYYNEKPPMNNTIKTDVNYRTYYIDRSGNMLFGRYFARAGEFHDGFAYVQVEGNIIPTPNIKNAYAYIDMTGNIVTDMKFDYASDFIDGKAKVIKDGIEGTIDINFVFTPNN